MPGAIQERQTDKQTNENRSGHWRDALLLAAIALLALVVRVVDLHGRSLWYDELHSVTYGALPIDQLLRSVRAFDPHPPLYYIQLHLWMCAGYSDSWIKLNSVVWSVLALLMTFVASRRMFGLATAAMAALIFSVSPCVIFYAHEARMYSMLMLLAIASVYCIDRYVTEQRWAYLVPALLAAEAFLYGHGAGFMLLASLLGYALSLACEDRRRNWKRFRGVGFAMVVMALLYVPWLLAARSISVPYAQRPDLREVVDTLLVLLYGVADHPPTVLWIVGSVFAVGVVLGMAGGGRIRAIVVGFVIVPCIVCGVVSYWLRPIWLVRTLVYAEPLWSIVLAYLVVHGSRLFKLGTARRWAGVAMGSGMVAALVYGTTVQQATSSYRWNVRGAATFLGWAAKPGDVVYVPNERLFWGVCWYCIGPASVDPLRPRALLSRAGVRVVTGAGLPEPAPLGRCWVVYRDGDDIAPYVARRADGPGWDFAGLKVVLLRGDG